MEQYTFFFKTSSPFSQWYSCKFAVDNIEYNCAEQFMMYKKAVLFEDGETADKILHSKEPRKQKELGRTVANFNNERWETEAEKIVYIGNYFKFKQNENLRKYLIDTKGTLLVEASPNDPVWGIGLSETDPDRFDKNKWKGKNQLGKILTAIRDGLLLEEKDKF